MEENHPPSSSPLKNNLKTSEAAAFLNIRPATLEQWRWSGRGPRYIKIGRSVRYRLTDLNAYLDERVCKSTTESHATL
jgi:predicted DNA-binding transcriptional regulator AlpA